MTSTGPIHHTNDTRVKHEYAILNGRRFHYVIGKPTTGRPHKATVILVHGWPDIWYGWRHTIPALLTLDLQVIAIDMMGYGGTEAPRVAPPPGTQQNLKEYSMKTAADAIAELARQLNLPKIVLIGHDWGSMVVYRTTNYHPNLVTHLTSICVPYMQPLPEYIPLPDLVKIRPNFTYQLALVDPQTELDLQKRENVKNFLSAIHRAPGEGLGKRFNVATNIVGSCGYLPRSKYYTEDELEYYTDCYYNNGFNGPLSWYKTRKINYDDELSIKDPVIHCPTLFIGAEQDAALPPHMAKGQEKYFDNLTSTMVKTSHWAMTEDPVGVNKILKDWFEQVVFGGKSKL